MKARAIYLYERKQTTGSVKGTRDQLLGTISWSERRGLVWAVSSRRLERDLHRAVRERLQRGKYFIAAAVRSGNRVSGLRLERIQGEMPELLRCLYADEALWRKEYARKRITPVYREGVRD